MKKVESLFLVFLFSPVNPHKVKMANLSRGLCSDEISVQRSGFGSGVYAEG